MFLRRVSIAIDFLFCAFPVQLSDQISVKGFLPTFNFLGNLVEAAPNVASNLVTKYGETHPVTAQLYILAL